MYFRQSVINMGTDILLLVVLLCTIVIKADLPCAKHKVKNKSVLCVCNTTYCDTITRIPPPNGSFIVYTSSEDGLRFQKTMTKLENADNFKNVSDSINSKSSDINYNRNTLILDPTTTYQTIEGFGGAVTDSAAINWKTIAKPLQEHLIRSYFSEEGIEYNLIRVPIGGTDFSTHAYAYNDLPVDDIKLSNFTLAPEDMNFKIPMIKEAMKASKSSIHLVASTWSPPPWMKTNNDYTGYSRLKPQYYQTYADYHLKFIERYNAEGIPIWAITTTNEPTNGLTGMCFGINCLGWTASNMGMWIVNHLGPTIRNSSVYKEVKILSGDDQRLTIPYWMNLMVKEHPQVLNYIDGIAVHYYTDFMAPDALLQELSSFYPGKFILATEGCQGSMWFISKHVDLGSWQRAKGYLLDIIDDLSNNVVGWIDWNMCLNYKGGPTWAGNYVDSPIIMLHKQQAFVKQPMFYAMGHFSKFIPRGSRRINITPKNWDSSVYKIAFITPHDTAVVVLYNNGGANTTIDIVLNDKKAVLTVIPHSVSTIEIPLRGESIKKNI